MKSKVQEIGPFRGDQLPVRDGVYKRLIKGETGRVWCLFSKGQWYCSSYTYTEAQREVWLSNYQNLPWWGVVR